MGEEGHPLGTTNKGLLGAVLHCHQQGGCPSPPQTEGNWIFQRLGRSEETVLFSYENHP